MRFALFLIALTVAVVYLTWQPVPSAPAVSSIERICAVEAAPTDADQKDCRARHNLAGAMESFSADFKRQTR
jgi:hypothetical protein